MRAGFSGVMICHIFSSQMVSPSLFHDEPLSRDMLISFRKDGFMVVRNLVAPSIIASWRNQLWSFFRKETEECDPNDPRTWPPGSYARYHRASLHETASFTVAPPPESIPTVASALHQLVGPLMGTDPPPFNIALVNWPFQPWNMTSYDKVRLMDEIRASTTPAGHIDRFPPPENRILENYHEMVVRFQILLTDVGPGGGSTKYFNHR